MSIDIAKIDKNFAAKNDIGTLDLVFYDIKENDFCLFGVFYKDGFFRRMPDEIARATSEGVRILNTHTSGGRLRFMTDSSVVAVSTTMPLGNVNKHSGADMRVAGFDMYVNGGFAQSFIMPGVTTEAGYDSVRVLPGEGLREVIIHFPLYFEVNELRIGLDAGARFLPIPEERRGKRVLFYGSSITQGGTVSRPGGCFPNILAHKLGFDLINLGFSGNAKGEDIMCDYIADQNPDVFVMDYDHNAPTLAHLESTHERFFLRFRERHPSVPVIMLSAPNLIFDRPCFEPRREVIRATYENALARGDKNVRFIDGETLFTTEDADLCTVDRCHPNDLGHYRMAMAIAPVLAELL